MKQFQIEYNGKKEFSDEHEKFRKQWENVPGLMFQIFSDILEEDTVTEVTSTIETICPGVPWFGCSTCGNLVDCKLTPEIAVTATVFEKVSSRFKVFQYSTQEYSMEQVAQKIIEDTENEPWVKAIELYFAFPKDSTTKFSEGLKKLRSDIHIFGGIAGNDDIAKDVSYVFSNVGGYSDSDIVVVFYGGDDFYVKSIKATGWKPLGRKFQVTKADGTNLQELDGIPAYDVYNKYLNINNDENFFHNTLEFPLLYEYNGVIILRVPMASNPDRSVSVSADIEVGSTVRMSYGDPQTIIDSIAEDSKPIKQFSPDILHFFSCVARRTFWASDEPTYELDTFKDIAPSVGFYSLGEFLRADGQLSHHNVTLVIAAMREGEPDLSAMQNVSEATTISKVPLVSRLATFISATSLELEEMNQKLQAAAITDGMTGLYNRTEIERGIINVLNMYKGNDISLVMLDLDNFKRVNDTYGHKEGDHVIIALSDVLREVFDGIASAYTGRWGGEEFMVLLPGCTAEEAVAYAEQVRTKFSALTYDLAPSQTVSIGVTQAADNDTCDSFCSRVDKALYTAKANGKNQVVQV